MKRSGYIKRGKPPRQRRETPRKSGRVRSLEYMTAVAGLGCCADLAAKVRLRGSPLLGSVVVICLGRVEVDHAGRRGMGQKCSDFETIPLCSKHHRERTDFSGDFKYFDQATMRDFLEEAIARTQRALGYPERWT